MRKLIVLAVLGAFAGGANAEVTSPPPPGWQLGVRTVPAPGWSTAPHYVPAGTVTPPVTPPPVVNPPAVAPPPPGTVTPATAAPTSSAPAQPSQLPANKSHTGSAMGWGVFAGVAAYFTGAIVTHWLCAAEEDSRKVDDRQRTCYRHREDGSNPVVASAAPVLATTVARAEPPLMVAAAGPVVLSVAPVATPKRETGRSSCLWLRHGCYVTAIRSQHESLYAWIR